MCFCNMPPGIYRQRVKLNLNNILDELELPRFLVNFLFSDKVSEYIVGIFTDSFVDAVHS